MDVDGLTTHGKGMVDAQLTVCVAGAQGLKQARAGGIHRLLFQPAIGLFRIDDDDIRPIGITQPRGDCLRNAAGGEILAFGIDGPLRRRDLVEIESLNLSQRLLVVHFRRRAGNGYIDIFELHRQRVGPAIMLAEDRLQIAAASPLPTGAGMVAQHHRDIAL